MAPSEADKIRCVCCCLWGILSHDFYLQCRVWHCTNQRWSCRRYTVAEFEKAADDFAKKRFGCAGTLPDRLVEVRCCFACHRDCMQPYMAVALRAGWHHVMSAQSENNAG